MARYIASDHGRISMPSSSWLPEATGGFFFESEIRSSTRYGLTYSADESGGSTLLEGVDLTYDPRGRLTGGIFTSHTVSYEEYFGEYLELTTLTGIRVSAKALADAERTTTFSDDAAILKRMFADDDVMVGGSSRDVIRGYGGDDRLYGRAGQDSIAGYQGRDEIYAGSGDDFVRGGHGADKLFGGSGADRMLGDAGNDVFYGGSGRDLLTGGSGRDYFVFDSALSAANRDTLSDFNVSEDIIRLDRTVFTVLPGGRDLLPSAFHRGSEAQDSLDRIIYEQSTGRLFYDADGAGTAAAVQFAQLHRGLALSAENFDIVS